MTVRCAEGVTVAHTTEGAVLLNERTGAYWQTNRSGSDVLRSLLDGSSSDEIAQRIAGRTGVDPSRIRTDIEVMVDTLRTAGLIRR